MRGRFAASLCICREPARFRLSFRPRPVASLSHIRVTTTHIFRFIARGTASRPIASMHTLDLFQHAAGSRLQAAHSILSIGDLGMSERAAGRGAQSVDYQAVVIGREEGHRDSRVLLLGQRHPKLVAEATAIHRSGPKHV